MGCNCGGSSTTVQLKILTPTKLGRCAFCFYATLAMSVVGWAAYALLVVSAAPELLALAFLVLAFSSTLLFAAHVAAMAIRMIERLPPIPHSLRDYPS
jgi:hypothetical protein